MIYTSHAGVNSDIIITIFVKINISTIENSTGYLLAQLVPTQVPVTNCHDRVVIVKAPADFVFSTDRESESSCSWLVSCDYTLHGCYTERGQSVKPSASRSVGVFLPPPYIQAVS